MKHLSLTLAAIVLCGVPCAEAQDVQYPAGVAALAGTWSLNEALSDDIPVLPGEAMSLARSSGSVTPRLGPPAGSRLNRYHQIARVEHAIREAIDPGERLTISRSAADVLLSNGDGEPLSITPDGRRVRILLDGVRMDRVAQLQPPVLIVERRFEDGTVVLQRYAAFADPPQLVIMSTLTGPRLGRSGLTVRRVYDHAP